MEIQSAKHCLRFLQLVLLLVGLANGRRRDSVRLGRCPNYRSQPRFATSRFNGTWYVGHQFQRRFIECQTLNFIPMKNNKQSFQIEGEVRTTSTMTLKTKGESYVADETNPAAMRWSWNFFPSFIDYVTVLDTDYDNYAVIVLCNDYTIFHVLYPMVMTREKPLNLTEEYTSYIKRAEKVIPFQIYTGWTQTCSLDRYYPDDKVIVKSIDVDKELDQVNSLLSKLF